MSDIAPARPTIGRSAWIALAVVSLAQAVSMIDRQILAILLPRIKADLGVGDAEMGLLYGTVFALFYALFSLPLGRLADGWIRTRLLAIAITGWSAMTALAGFANSFALLSLSRLGVGVGEASVQPAGMSLLSDHFPKHRRGIVTAAMAAAVALGLGAALWIGGATADAWDAAYAAGGAPLGIKGWQAAFIVSALPGLVLALILWRMREPVRGEADGLTSEPDPAPFAASWRTLASILPGFNWIGFARREASAKTWAINLAGLILIVVAMTAATLWTDSLRSDPPPPIRLGAIAVSGNALQFIVAGFGIYVVLNWIQSLKLSDRPAHAILARTPALNIALGVTALQSVVNYGIMAWSPSFILATYDVSPAEVGLTFGALVAGLGIIGPIIAGPVSDWAQTRIAGGRIYVTLASLLVSPALAFYTYSAPTATSFYLRFIFYSLVLTMWLPPIYATFMDLVLPRMRGTIMSYYILTMTITGLGFGPYVVGLISDLNGGDIGKAILAIYWVAPVIVGLLIWLIRRLPIDEASMVARARDAGEPV